jgi:hypothetical protein
MVRSVRVGRESWLAVELLPIEELRDYLDQVSKQWDDALARLKTSKNRIVDLAGTSPPGRKGNSRRSSSRTRRERLEMIR